MAMRKQTGGRRGRAVYLAAIVAAGVISTAAWGQQDAAKSAADDAAWRRQIEERMQALEKENADLRRELGRVAETRAAVAKDAALRERWLSIDPRAGDSVTPKDFDTRKYIAEGDFPGSIRIPGTNVSLQVGGFVQVDAITDSNAIGSKDSFIVSSIPTSGATAGQTNFSVRQTRLFIKTEAPTGWGPLVTYWEGDFFGPDGTDLRLRHAYGQIGDKHQLLAGQTWTTFMDASTYPAIFDYQGPNAMVLVRQPMVRYSVQLRDDLKLQVALEDPNPDLSSEGSIDGSGTSLWPDFAANVRWTPKWGHLQLAGILRQLTFDPTSGSRSTELGWGLNVSGSVLLFEPVAKGKQDNLVFQFAGGQGIANYFNDTNGLGMDGFVQSDLDLQSLGILGGFVAYQHYWSLKWASSAGYSFLRVDDASGQGGDTYESGHYMVVNIMFYPTERIWMGLEALYGIREDQDGDTGDDLRLSFSVQYRF
jgi:hypothetical protein